MTPRTRSRLEFAPLGPERWSDLEALFGARGACGGCWCMSWRLGRRKFDAGKGEGNRRALRRLVERGEPVGVLAYEAGAPIGWCAVAPRESYPRLAASRILSPPDARPVWSITCLFVAKSARHRGIATALVAAAARHAASLGAEIVEGYPHDLDAELPAPFVWTGLLPCFERAGFREVARRSPKRPIVRWQARAKR